MMQAIEENVRYLETVVSAGGPKPEDYPVLADIFSRLHAASYREVDGLSQMTAPIRPLEAFLEANRDIFRNTESMQGFAFTKPRGYAGDFEIIERIYDTVISADAQLGSWDRFFHSAGGANAVRNRPGYIEAILRKGNYETMLSLGCGSARDLSVTNGPGTLQHITLVDTDPDALAQARVNLSNPKIEYTFLQKNVLRLREAGPFDLIWSAGLFDYLNDRLAIHLLGKARNFMNDGARIVIGNFSKNHESRPYMELVCEWRLIHRSEQEMANLMTAAGFEAKNVTVESDETGVNLFANAIK